MNVVIYNQNTSLSVADSIDPSSILDTHLDMTTLMTGFQNSTAEGTISVGQIEVGRDPKLSESCDPFQDLQLSYDYIWTPKSGLILDNSVIQSTVEIKEIPGLVKWSEHNSKYHVKSGQQGKMEMTFLASNVPAIDSVKEWYLQLELRRTDPKWSHVPVNELRIN